jgi:hypothetical protein
MATRAEVIAAYAANPKAELRPNEEAIQFWMNNDLGQFNTLVDQVRAANPTLAAQIDAQRATTTGGGVTGTGVTGTGVTGTGVTGTGVTGTGTVDNSALYRNLVTQAYGGIGRTGFGTGPKNIDQGGYDFWLNALNSGTLTPQNFQSSFNRAVGQYVTENPTNLITQNVQAYKPFQNTGLLSQSQMQPQSMGAPAVTNYQPQSVAQNFQNYMGIPIGAQYNPAVTAGGAAPYSQIKALTPQFVNPYAGVVANTAMGGYNPMLYEQVKAAARAAGSLSPTDYLIDQSTGGSTDGGAPPGDGLGGTGGASGDCVDPDVHILLADRSTVRAGDLKVGDMLHTLHDTTFVYDDFPVEYVNILQRPKVEALFDDGQKIIISITHKFLTADNQWEKISDIEIGTSIRGFGDITKKLVSITDVGTGPVIEMVVTDAHTYISEGLVSHNKFYGGLITNVSGPDPAGPDEGQVNMMRGEYVIKKSAVDKYGKGLLDMINEGKVPVKKAKSLLF